MGTIRVCGGGMMTRRLPGGTECPNEDAHTLSPSGYNAWHEWAARKSKTHRQVRCGGCGRLAIWCPKEEA